MITEEKLKFKIWQYSSDSLDCPEFRAYNQPETPQAIICIQKSLAFIAGPHKRRTIILVGTRYILGPIYWLVDRG